MGLVRCRFGKVTTRLEGILAKCPGCGAICVCLWGEPMSGQWGMIPVGWIVAWEEEEL